LFTDEKSRLPDTGEAQVYIAVQDICLDHADVSRRAPTEQSALGAAQEQELAITLLHVIRLPFAALTTADDMLRIALS